MERKSSTQRERFFTGPNRGDSEFEFLNHQVIANLPQNATEISFSNTYEIWSFGKI